jgi:hypothetical protein
MSFRILINMQVIKFQIQVELAIETTKPRKKCLSIYDNFLVPKIAKREISPVDYCTAQLYLPKA